jgi:hypothetical protein
VSEKSDTLACALFAFNISLREFARLSAASPLSLRENRRRMKRITRGPQADE